MLEAAGGVEFPLCLLHLPTIASSAAGQRPGGSEHGAHRSGDSPREWLAEQNFVDIREMALPSEKGGHQDPKAGATPAPPRTMAADFFPFFPLHAVVPRIRLRFRYHGECLSPAVFKSEKT